MARFDEIKLAGQLPSPKGVALAIMNLCGREDCTIEDVARLVQTDPALSGRLLRLANSSGGTHRPVSAINEALLRIGMKAVAQLTMGFSLVDQFKDGPCKGFDYRNFWSRSLLMALASRELGRLTRAAAPEDLFACGLLANIGSLALATAFPVEYSELLESDRSNLLALEHEAFGIDQRQCALAMIEEFGIPKALAEPVFYHQSPDESQFSEGSRPHTLTWLFHTASHLADLGIAAEKVRSQLVGSLIRLGGRFQMDADGTAAFFESLGLPGVLAHGMLTMGLAAETVVPWLGDAGRIVDYGVRFTRPVVVDAESGADVVVAATVGQVDDEFLRIDLTVSAGETTVLGKAQLRVRRDG